MNDCVLIKVRCALRYLDCVAETGFARARYPDLVCCSVLQCVAMRCSVLQCVAVCCAASGCLASAYPASAIHCNMLQLQCVAAVAGSKKSLNTQQHTATHCNTLQHAATHCLCIPCLCNTGMLWISRLFLIDRSLLQNIPIKETIFCKKDL